MTAEAPTLQGFVRQWEIRKSDLVALANGISRFVGGTQIQVPVFIDGQSPREKLRRRFRLFAGGRVDTGSRGDRSETSRRQVVSDWTSAKVQLGFKCRARAGLAGR
jgi:hypothetical protein